MCYSFISQGAVYLCIGEIDCSGGVVLVSHIMIAWKVQGPQEGEKEKEEELEEWGQALD